MGATTLEHIVQDSADNAIACSRAARSAALGAEISTAAVLAVLQSLPETDRQKIVNALIDRAGDVQWPKHS